MSRFVINSIPFETRLSHDAKQILARDQARAKKLMGGLHPHGPAAFHQPTTKRNIPNGTSNSIDVTDSGVAYSVPVGVGQPPTMFSLLLDTSSPNTWVGADKEYLPTSTSINNNRMFKIVYGSGEVLGTEYLDQVTLGGNLVAMKQRIGVATSACGFSGVDGILGIGPVNVSLEMDVLDSVHNPGSEVLALVTENLFDSGVIPTISIGMSYFPDGSNLANGEITFGATDTAKFTGSVNYVPITTIDPSDKYWGIDADIAYDKDKSLLSLRSSTGIVDVGTTFLLLASDAFKVYRRATGAEEDSATGLLTVTEAQFTKMKSLFFTIGSETYELTPNAQIWPRRLNDIIGGEKGKIYLIVADMGSPNGNGLDFITGFTFLQRFYSVFDATNRRFGLARTKYTAAEIN